MSSCHVLKKCSSIAMHYNHLLQSCITRHCLLQAARVSGSATLVSLEQSLFLAGGGTRAWLGGGPGAVPGKLARLEEVNTLLCHNPRRITSKHIKTLTDGEESFSITEAVQAMGKLSIKLFCSLIKLRKCF